MSNPNQYYMDMSGKVLDYLPEFAVVGQWGSHPFAMLPVDEHGNPQPLTA